MRLFFGCLGLCGLILSSGCAARRPAESLPADPERRQVQAFFQQARDPRRFAMHVYDSKEGVVFIGAQRLHANQVAELPFKGARDDSTPVIDVRVWSTDNASPALVDTGAAESWIPFETALEWGVTPLGPPVYERRPLHAGEDRLGYAGVLPGLRLEQLHVENPVVFVRMQTGGLGPLARGAEPTPRLVIGCELLRAFRTLQFDFPQRRLTFLTSHPYEPDDTRLLATVPLAPGRRRLALEGRVDGRPVLLVLDSAAPYALALPEPAEDIAQQLTLGELVLRRVPVESLPEGAAPRIGRGILDRFKITIDNRRGLVYFERP